MQLLLEPLAIIHYRKIWYVMRHACLQTDKRGRTDALADGSRGGLTVGSNNERLSKRACM